jgi:tetratricopeptide (TPR) repeat protein
MQPPLVLLRAVAGAVRDAVPPTAEGGALIDDLPRRARAAWETWCRAGTEADRRVEAMALVRAPGEAVRALARHIAAEVAPEDPAEARPRLATYLALIPRLLRRRLRCTEDPRGLTVSPALVPHNSEGLLPLLPVRLPHYRRHDRPLPGVDRELDELLGIGPFGETWLARDATSPTAPATVLKFCLDPAVRKGLLGRQATVLFYLLQQGRYLSGAVPLRQTYLASSPPCLEYDYIGGGDLADLTFRLHHSGSPVEAMHRVAQRLARAVAAGHRLTPPIVHRNLKPSNVLFLPRDDRRVSLRLDDYLLGDDTLPDPRDDVRALGVLWYQVLVGDLTNAPPADAGRRRARLENDVAAPVVELLQECLDDDPARRPANADVLATRIEEVVAQAEAQSQVSTPEAARAGVASPEPQAPGGQTQAARGGAGVVRSAAEWFAEGNRLLEHREYREAVRAFSNAAAAGYDEAVVCRRRAAARAGRLDFKRAIADLDRLVQLRGGEAESYLLRGETLLAAGRIDRAIEDFGHAHQLDARSARAYIGRGRTCLAKGEFDLALGCFDRAQKRDPRGTDAFRYRGDVWVRRGDLDRAVEEYTAGLRLRPNDAPLLHARGEACLLQLRADQAIADFTEAIRVDWKFAPAHHGRGRVFLRLREWGDALMDLNQAIRLDRRCASAYVDRAAVHICLGKRRAALADLRRATKYARRDPQPFVSRGLFLTHLGRADEAIADFTRALRRDKSCADAYAGRGAAFRVRGKLKRAVTDLTRAIALQPDSVQAHLERGRVYLAAGQYRRARADADEVLRRQPNNAGAISLKRAAGRTRRAE